MAQAGSVEAQAAALMYSGCSATMYDSLGQDCIVEEVQVQPVARDRIAGSIRSTLREWA